MCAVTPAGVRKWIRSGKLKAYSTPGGQYRVAEGELHHFLTEHGMPTAAGDMPRSDQTVILVVDDEPDIVELIRETLSMGHPEYRIISTYDGYDACILAGSEKPDLLVLDLVLPGLDGFEVARHIRQNPATGSVGILVVTAFDPLLTEDLFQELHISAVVEKPFEPATLVTEVQRVLRAMDNAAEGG